MPTDESGSLQAWRILRTEDQLPVDGHVPVRLLNAATARGPLRAALSESSAPRLLLPVSGHAGQEWFNGADALSVKTISLKTDSGTGNFVDVCCVERRLERVFADVCDAIAARIASGESTAQACTRTLTEFAALFRSRPLPTIDARTIRGLLGELLFLDTLLTRHSRTIELWCGPEQNRHDFIGGHHAVEVKTIARPESPVTISSLDQLMEPPEGQLHLRVYELFESSAGEVSVAELVNRISSRCDDPSRFLSLVESLGYTDRAEDPWTALRFNIGCVRQWQVNDEFPRITRETLVYPVAGLIEASYAIRPSDVPACQVDTDGQNQMIQKLLDSLDSV